jgi:uncharacterized small protein (DUF1192 family)
MATKKSAVKAPKAVKSKAGRDDRLPPEVQDWVEQATSRIRWLTNEVARLKDENKKLKAYQKFAEQRILKSDHDDR